MERSERIEHYDKSRKGTMTKIIQYPNSILTTPCIHVDFEDRDRIAAIVEDLERGMCSTRKAVGISAPQVDWAYRAFILDTQFLKIQSPNVFLNPVMADHSALEDLQDESCMSLPASIKIPIRRYIGCKVRAYGTDGKEFTVALEGLAARAAQHELDHLDGKTILDHATKKQKRIAIQKLTVAIKQRAR
jgi:peptide deformylase